MIEADIKKINNNIEFNSYCFLFHNKIVTNSKCCKVQIKNCKTRYILWGLPVFFLHNFDRVSLEV